MDQALQIEQLDRRILALELRLRRLEKALQRAGEPDATTVPDEQRDTPTK
ncbi:MAG: hypothetical protein SGJ20_15465 [Planctomycetota bacterium]|nr:hypothetical protein [Planctomycetota bacterium]